MALYSITYDLVKDRDYPELYKAIISLCNNTYARPTKSQWIVQSTKTPKQIVEFLMKYIDHDDVIFVIQVDATSWWSVNMNKTAVNWLKAASN